MSDLTNRPHERPLPRRGFLRAAAGSAAATLLLPDRVLAEPYAPWQPTARLDRRPVRVRGAVRAGGRGLAGVAVTDGIRVVDTRADGTFDLVSSSEREFVYLTLPAGYRVPLQPAGTARHFQPLRPDAHDEARAEFALEPLAGGDERHTMLLLADVQAEDAREMARFHAETVPDLHATLRALGGEHAFAVACGDIVFDEHSLFPEYERAMRELGIPAFQVVGNHDLDKGGPTAESATHTFRGRFGPNYYSFDRGRVHYVVLDDVFYHATGYIGYLDADQLAWLEQDLARREPGTPLVVMLHIPVEGTRNLRNGGPRHTLGGSVANREYLYRLTERFRTHFIAGHTHDAEHLFEGGAHGHVSGTVCGAWWTGDLCGDGTPNGYAVYEARGEEVRWRYKATGHPDGHQIRAYAAGAVPEAPHEIAANVWDWDPAWRVVLYEGADRRVPMVSRVAVDPVARETLTPARLPEGRRWVEPYATGHMLFAPAPEGRGPLRVEATDRFGRVHVAEVPAA